MAPPFASWLSSPTILFRLPTPPHVSPPDERSYTVHRSLLTTHTSLLSSGHIRPHTKQLLLPSTTSQAALEALLEYLYTGSYTLPFGSQSHETASGPKGVVESNPLLEAAMAGAIGIWGSRPAAVHEPAVNISSYVSEHVPEHKNEYETLHEKAGPKPAALPSPPHSPKFDEYEPSLKPQKSKPAPQAAKPVPWTPENELLSHLDVYAIARRYSVAGLQKEVLRQISALLGKDNSVLRELVREVYGTKTKDRELSDFVVGTVTGEWEKYKKAKVVRDLLKEGGEFVVDVFERL